MGRFRVQAGVVERRMEVPYWKPGDPGYSSGLAESLESLGKSLDFLEPVIQGGTMGFMSGALGVYSLIPGASEPLLGQDSRGQRTCHCPLYSFSYSHTPSLTCFHHRLYHARATTVFLWPGALPPHAPPPPPPPRHIHRQPPSCFSMLKSYHARCLLL